MDKREIHLTFERSTTTASSLLTLVKQQCKDWVNTAGCSMVTSFITGLIAEGGESFKITLSIEEL